MAKVVARGVSAILRELLGEPEIRRPVQAVHKAIDDGLSDKVEPRDRSERVGIEKSLEH
jgi:hypothetical protein